MNDWSPQEKKRLLDALDKIAKEVSDLGFLLWLVLSITVAVLVNLK